MLSNQEEERFLRIIGENGPPSEEQLKTCTRTIQAVMFMAYADRCHAYNDSIGSEGMILECRGCGEASLYSHALDEASFFRGLCMSETCIQRALKEYIAELLANYQ